MSDQSRLTALLQDRDPSVRRIARLALHRLPSAAGTDAATVSGFVVVDSEAAALARALADKSAPGTLPLNELIEAGAADAGAVAALVTELIGRVIDDADAEQGIWQIGTHLAAEPTLRPDLTGLLSCYRVALARSDDVYLTLASSSADRGLDEDLQSYLRARLVIAWIISRGGLAALVPALDGELGATEPARRYSAALLIAECAWSAAEPAPPDVLAPPAAGPVVVEAPTATPETVVDRDVQFTVYRPRAIRPDRWYPLLAFAHRSTPFLDEDGLEVDPLVEVAHQAQGLLRARMDSYGAVVADSATSLPRGDQLVFEPWLERGELNPPRATLRWEEPVHRTEFRLRASEDAIGRRLEGGMRVYLGVLLIAELRFALQVDAGAGWSANERPDQKAHASPYRRIFASYSHRDTEIVERVRAAAVSLGDRYLIDVEDLRVGELWEPRLGELIEEASVFQLFWSKNSMRSPFVRREWEHALSLRRPYFIRPVFWEVPQPVDPHADLPPIELRRIQFCRLATDVVPPPAGHRPEAAPGRSDSLGGDEPPASFGQPMEVPAGRSWEQPLPPSAPSRGGHTLLVSMALVLVLIALTVWRRRWFRRFHRG